MKALVFVFTLLLTLAAHADWAEPLRTLPVQDAGRAKPFDTFARESLQLVYGRQSFNGRSATEVVMTWLLIPQHWHEQPIVQMHFAKLKEALKLDVSRSYFSPREILGNERLSLVMNELSGKRQSKSKLNPYDQAVAQLESQIGLFHEISAARYPRVAPPLAGSTGTTWLAVNELPQPLAEAFREVATSFVRAIGLAMEGEGVAAKGQVDAAAAQQLREHVERFRFLARAQNPEMYPPAKDMQIEAHYNHLAPFQKSWILYLCAVVLIALSFLRQPRWLNVAIGASLVAALMFHGYGFALRIYLTGRPPVSNMYETVIWVSLGVMIFSLIFARIFRNRLILLASSCVATLCLIVADLAPTVLDPTLQPLEPVLRSNYWLIVHVMTITLSYAAFFLAFGLGDIGLVYYLRSEENHREAIKALAATIYRVVQVGVVLVVAGTILGGWWADESWGRFWGWDPKETWAFIVAMGYIALLHARIAGWAKDLGTIAGSVVAFALVMMAWYGVNFVLGAGKHTYGFGAGGVQYVAGFVAVHLVFTAYVVWTVQGRRRQILA